MRRFFMGNRMLLGEAQGSPKDQQPVAFFQGWSRAEDIVTDGFNFLENSQPTLHDESKFPTESAANVQGQWCSLKHHRPCPLNFKGHQGSPAIVDAPGINLFFADAKSMQIFLRQVDA